MKSKKIRRRLDEAVGADHVVRVVRRTERGSRYSGFVLRVGAKWVLMAPLADGGAFDGLIAIRLREVHSVRRDTTFAARAARLRPEWPPSSLVPAGIDLDTTAGVLRTIAAEGELIGIQTDQRLYALWIGLLHEVTRRWVYLHEVRPDASWRDVPLGYRLGRIDTVEAGGQYLRGLRTVAGRGPSA
ncbi:hypothetical protein QP735_13310 [Curtobacterium citreum]|uniref:hypothetical protein n=1 Tax=Curtobacterium citreum TaxID=2036 RepID=UPI00254A9A0B|nr:hypothetical protein [Curtobacterium citreum]MDK8173504.1 hypothetical protein [Curtobacterium citreum]